MKLFVAGSHTDVGKTWAACALLRTARRRGLSVDAFKPVLSGFDPAEWSGSDAGRLLTAVARPHTDEELEGMSPLRFAAPLAPPQAARLEGRSVTLAQIVAACRHWLARSDAQFQLVESAGGLMSPIADDGTVVDLAEALALPVVLVGGSYLGAISHTLTAIEVLRGRGLAPAAVVLSQDASPAAPDFAETLEMVGRFAPAVRVLGAPRSCETGWPEDLLDALASAGEGS